MLVVFLFADIVVTALITLRRPLSFGIYCWFRVVYSSQFPPTLDLLKRTNLFTLGLVDFLSPTYIAVFAEDE